MVDLKAFQQFVEQAETVTPAMEKLGRSMREIAYRTSVMIRPLARLHYSEGDRHVDRVCKEILAGVPGRDPALRLLCASDLAEVIDRG